MRLAMTLCLALIMAGATLLYGGDFATAAPNATFMVNDLGDDSDENPGDGVCATAGGVCTLRAAIEESNQLAGADVINFDLPIGSEIAAASDELVITDAVTIDGESLLGVLVSTGFSFHRVLRVTAAPEDVVILRGLYIAGGVLPVGLGAGVLLEAGTLHLDNVGVQYNYAQNYHGGGVAVTDGTLYVTNSFIRNNTAADRGGGLYNWGDGTVIISDSVFYQNEAATGAGLYNSGVLTSYNSAYAENDAGDEGGGIANTGPSLTVIGGLFLDNVSTRGAGMAQDDGDVRVIGTHFEANIASNMGGAISSQDLITVIGSTLSNNRAHAGGGIANQAVITISQTMFDDNQAFSRGGGVYNFSGGVMTIDQSTLTRNSAEQGVAVNMAGGAINNFNSSLVINNSTVSGNFAEEDGGGIHTFGGSARIYNSTIAFNESGGSGGVRLGDQGKLQFRNSIVANNIGDDCAAHAANVSGIVAVDANLDSDGTCPNFTLSGEAPQLGILADNGGSTPTHLLEINSPAINVGAMEGCLELGNRDQRDLMRVAEGESACDLGAVERDGTVPPTPTPEPEETPAVEETPAPEETPQPQVTPGAEETPEAEETPQPEETPEPEATPDPEETPLSEATPTPETTPVPEDPETTGLESLYLPNVAR